MAGIRIIMMSDTHEQHDNIMGIEHSDILLHAGDFTYRGELPKVREFSKWLGDLPNKYSNRTGKGFKHRVIIPGNHELNCQKNFSLWNAIMMEGATAFLDSQVVECEGLAIYGEPRQPEFCGWEYNVPKQNMYFVWEQVPTSTDILLTHGPPFGAGDLTRDGIHVGCVYQREWIEKHQPMFVVCGHIHGGRGLYKIGKTTVVNASICDETYKPNNKPFIFEVT